MSGQDVISTIKEKGVKYVDFRFCDTKGKEQHVTVPAHTIDDSVFTEGKTVRRSLAGRASTSRT